MLSQVRGALKGAGAWFVVILLILAFALWGVPELRTMGQTSALKVGDKGFSSQFIQSEFTRQVNVRRQESGGEFTRADAIAQGMPDQVIQTLATSSALEQAAAKMGLVTPRSIVKDYLQTNENFQNPVSGKFDKTVLETILRNNSMSVQQFEQRIADEILRNQLVGSIVSSGAAPAPMAEAMMLRETERREVAYLVVTEEMSGVPAEPTPDELQTYYKAFPAAFTAPEYRTLELVMLDEESFRDGLDAPEEELRRIYDLNKERLYEVPARRTLYQITFENEVEAQAAAAALQQGKPFETIAIEQGRTLEAVTFSEYKKGDILDPSVNEAAFAEDKGEGDIIGPINGLFGWSVVQIAGVLPPETQSFEDVRDDIESEYLNADTRRKMLDTIDQIEEARDTGASLADAATELGLTVQTFGPVDQYSFAPGGAIIDGVPGEALREAFLLEEGDESEAEELAVKKGYFFVALDEITPPALMPFEDIRDEVDQRWRKEERDRRISDTVSKIIAAVKEGQSLEDAAQPFNRTPVVETMDRRTAIDAISGELRDKIFFAELNDLISGKGTTGSAQVVAEIREIGYARSTISPQEAQSYRQYLGFQLDQEMLEAYIANVRDEFGVKVDRAQLDTLLADG